MLLPRGRCQQLYLLHATSYACTEQRWTDFSHKKGVCLEPLGFQKLLTALLRETGIWIKSYGAISWSPAEALVLHASEPQSQSTCFEGTSDLETCLLTTHCVSTPTPKLGLSQHIHPSLCLLSNACGSSFKACSVARNAKGNGTLLSDQLWVFLPACTASLRSSGWTEQQDSNCSDTLGCIFGANTPRNVTQYRPGEQTQILHHCPDCWVLFSTG